MKRVMARLATARRAVHGQAMLLIKIAAAGGLQEIKIAAKAKAVDRPVRAQDHGAMAARRARRLQLDRIEPKPRNRIEESYATGRAFTEFSDQSQRVSGVAAV